MAYIHYMPPSRHTHIHTHKQCKKQIACVWTNLSCMNNPDETDGRTDRQTDRPTGITNTVPLPAYRGTPLFACTALWWCFVVLPVFVKWVSVWPGKRSCRQSALNTNNNNNVIVEKCSIKLSAKTFTFEVSFSDPSTHSLIDSFDTDQLYCD